MDRATRATKGLQSLFLHRFKILAYHSVYPNSRDLYEVSVTSFERQMDHLARAGYQVLGLKEAIIRICQKSIDPKMIAITFDDGFKSIQENAFPILKRFGFPATVFLPIHYMGNIDGFSYEHTRAEMEIMGWSDVVQAINNGISFGSHTLTHPALTLLDDALLEAELSESKAALEKYVDHDMVALAYPFGLYDERVKRKTIEAGYDCALGFGNVMSNTCHTDLYELKREKILSTTTQDMFESQVDVGNDFKRKIAGMFSNKA